MILSAKIVKDPQEIKHCEVCGWPIFSRMLKLYGYAEEGDKPYNLFYHHFKPLLHHFCTGVL